MTELPEALAPLAEYKQFIIHTQADKIPRHATTGAPCDPHDPANQMDAKTALAIADASPGYGVGFVLTARDPFFFLDIDNALQADSTWSPLALQLCEQLAGTAVEVSQSGKGLHIIGTGPVPAHGCKNIPLGIELYTESRYVALTGKGAVGSVLCRPQGLEALVSNHFAPSAPSAETEWTDQPCAEWNGPASDEELITRMLTSRSAGSIIGNRASTADLWAGDEDALSRAYPDQTGERAYDASSADAALCAHLAFWTGRDCERMNRLFMMSGLVRDKWTTREDYSKRTILSAAGRCTNVLGSSQRPPDETTPSIRSGFQFKALTDVVDYFKGFVYVRDVHRVFTPDGALLKPETFRSYYGGWTFALDSINDKVTRNAWEAFVESQGYNFNKAHSICFRPELPPGTLIEEEGHTIVNTYVPAQVTRTKGDASPFTSLLKLMLPTDTDRAILLAYMASLVQNPGRKFQWCPLLQGVEGNGKTFLMKCMTYAVGQKYTHLPNASDLGGNGSKFNSWISRKLFIGVEEIYGAGRREVLDALKPLITNDRIEIQGKGQDQFTGDNRANFIMCSNHKDAVIKTRNDRRFAVFYTAHQSVDDLKRDGIGADAPYFPSLWRWASSGGYAIVAEFLASYPVPDALNPATKCHRAPTTSSTVEVLAVSMGGVEQEIMEAIAEGRAGFHYPWVSSTALNRLLSERGDTRRISPQRRKDILEELGYILHPGLTEGRSTSVIPLDGGRPRLYIKRGDPAANITVPHDIVIRYQADQGVASL